MFEWSLKKGHCNPTEKERTGRFATHAELPHIISVCLTGYFTSGILAIPLGAIVGMWLWYILAIYT